MGNCSSCLGSRRQSVYEEDEDSRLLFDDPDAAHYGSFGDPNLNGQGDAQEVQRELEALQRVVAHTSDNMVDVFEITQPASNLRGIPNPYTLGIPDDRLMRYQSLLSKLSPSEEIDAEARIEDCDEVDIIAEPERGFLPKTADISGPFVGNFADAAKVAF